MQPLAFFGAAIFEIAGCWLVWLALRNGQPWLWLPAIGALAAFAWLLTLSDTNSAGRAFVIYGGIYIVASVAFMVGVERVRPDMWDIVGVLVVLAGAGIIYFGPRAS